MDVSCWALAAFPVAVRCRRRRALMDEAAGTGVESAHRRRAY